MRVLAVTLRTTLAAVLGLFAAAVAGADHPWWAAMTVFLVAQPTRGLLLERAIARLAGTAVGAGAGYLMLRGLGGAQVPTLIVLTGWLALCAAGGSVLRHFRTYMFVLAGYSAAIVVLPRLAHGGEGPFVAADRLWCTVIGILASTLIALGPRGSTRGDTVAGHYAALVGRVLDRVERYLAGTGVPASDALAVEIARLDDAVDDAAAGSLRERRTARRVRRTTGLLLETVALTASSQGVTQAAISGETGVQRVTALRDAAAVAGQAALASTLDQLALWMGTPDRRLRWRRQWAIVSAPRAARAAARPIVAVTLASLLWLTTDFGEGAVMTMTAALFTSLFSSHAHGNQAMRDVLAGACAGVVLGAAYRLAILPHVAGIVATTLSLVPMLLAGAWLMGRRSTAKMAIDLTLCFLLVSRPFTPPSSLFATIQAAAAIVTGVLIAAATFWLVLPASDGRRTRALRRRAIRLARRIGHDADRDWYRRWGVRHAALYLASHAQVATTLTLLRRAAAARGEGARVRAIARPRYQPPTTPPDG